MKILLDKISQKLYDMRIFELHYQIQYGMVISIKKFNFDYMLGDQSKTTMLFFL